MKPILQTYLIRAKPVYPDDGDSMSTRLRRLGWTKLATGRQIAITLY